MQERGTALQCMACAVVRRPSALWIRIGVLVAQMHTSSLPLRQDSIVFPVGAVDIRGERETRPETYRFTCKLGLIRSKCSHKWWSRKVNLLRKSLAIAWCLSGDGDSHGGDAGLQSSNEPPGPLMCERQHGHQALFQMWS